MKSTIATVLVCLLATAIAFAGNENMQKKSSKTKPRKTTPAALDKRLTEMQTALEAQQAMIQQLRQELQGRDSAIQQLQQQVNQVQTSATEAQHKAEQATAANATQQSAVATVNSQVTDLRSNVESNTANLQQTNKAVKSLESPLAIHFKGITLTPGGYLEAAGIYRTHNENSDVTSTFTNIPFSGTANSHLSEFRGTARQSRISLLAEGKINTSKVSGYYEVDFLGAAPTANELQSNSFNLRQRQLWGQVEMQNGFSFLGGQSWSLITTNRSGITPRKEFIPDTIDSQYVVGFNFLRVWNARVTKKFSDHVWGAVAIENPEMVLSVTNPPAGVFGFNTSPNAQSPSSQFTLSNVPGANGISTDVAPDLIAKVAFEPGWGHYEIKALGRFFRDRIAGSNNYIGGGGGGFGAILPATKKLDVILEGLVGVGIGRYGDTIGADVTLRPDGTIVPVHSLQALAGLEHHPTPKLELYAYGGEEYYGRAAYVNAAGMGVGYGTPLGNNTGCSIESPTATQLCQAQTRNIWQAQPGFWYRFYKGEHGTVQYGMSYSYTYKNTWVGAGGLSPKAIENMVMSSFRYYLP
jgi:peptidoglycan hydrolase CwlO-like protein